MDVSSEALRHLENGRLLSRRGRLDASIVAYSRAIQCETRLARAYFYRGVAYIKQGRAAEAERDLSKALELEPDHRESGLWRIVAVKALGDSDEAMRLCQILIDRDPDYVEALLQGAALLSDALRFGEATDLYARALRISPEDRRCRISYGHTLVRMGHSQEALEQYMSALEGVPDDADLLQHIGYALVRTGEVEAAVGFYRRAIEAAPNHALSHLLLGCALILLEEFKEGFAEYEWRRETASLNTPLPVDLVEWTGDSGLGGKRILVLAEQGLGDTLQFIRFVRQLRHRGAETVVAVQRPLTTILSGCDYLGRVVSLGDERPPCDLFVPLMSLPHVLGTEVDSIPQDIPYLDSSRELARLWGGRLAQDEGFRIGICWQGNQRYEEPELRRLVEEKSMPLDAFEPVGRLPGVTLYCLQKNSGKELMQTLFSKVPLRLPGGDFDRSHGAFMDTAAIMNHLDLVITVDTSIAHLAGGLGVPVWVVLPKPADFRWMRRERETPWYPQMRLFRQSVPGDWVSVVKKIAEDVVREMSHRKK